MATLEWDNIAERRYETGVDRGVLYGPSGPGVAWSGLVSVSDDGTPEVKSHFYEGRRALVRVVPGAYSGKIEAITYPDLLDDLTGLGVRSPGVRVHDSRHVSFGLTYRTLIGSPGDGLAHGYKIHILYGLMAVSDGVTAKTIGQTIEPNVFTWTVTGMQTLVDENGHPINHISLDSREINPEALATIEAILYGTTGSDPALPDPLDLIP